MISCQDQLVMAHDAAKQMLQAWVDSAPQQLRNSANPLTPSCWCVQLDTECDFGYEHSWHHNGSCVPMTGFNLDTCPHVKDHSYQISKSGLRLLGGDM